MNDRPSEFVFDFMFIVIVVGLATSASFLFGYTNAAARCKAIQIEAVEHGYAEWVPDSKGKVTFTWKETK